MDNKRIDTKLIIKAKTKQGHIVFIGPPSLNYFRWPNSSDHTYGKPFVEFNADTKQCNSCNVKIRASLQSETQDKIVLIEGKRADTEGHYLTFDKYDTQYSEVCYDFRFFRFIDFKEIESYELINIENKDIQDLTDQEIEQSNIKTLSQLAPALLEIKDWQNNLTTEEQKIDRMKKVSEIRSKCNQHIASRAKIQKNNPQTYKNKEILDAIKKTGNLNAPTFHQAIKTPKITVDNNPLVIQSTNQFANKPISGKSIQKPKKSKGLGDTVKKFTEKLGIKQCGGCKKRQQWLNKYFPYK